MSGSWSLGQIACLVIVAVIAGRAAAEPTVENLGLALGDCPYDSPVSSAEWLAFCVGELAQGRVDRNGDGDVEDMVLHLRNLATGATTNLRLALAVSGLDLQGDWLAFTVSESQQGWTDLNGDGDLDDAVLHVHQLSTGITTNLQLEGGVGELYGDWLAFTVAEAAQGGQRSEWRWRPRRFRTAHPPALKRRDDQLGRGSDGARAPGELARVHRV